MHLGSLKTIGTFGGKNLKYIVLNNNAHDSVGGQKTYSDKVDFLKLSKSLGFKSFQSIESKNNLKNVIKKFLFKNELSFLEVKVANSKIKNLPRPKDLIKIKKQFMQ